MAALLEASADETELNSFAHLIPQDEGGDVPDSNTFLHLIPKNENRPPETESEELNTFAHLIPKSPTAETEKALAETGESDFIKLEKGLSAIAPPLSGLHDVLNSVRVFGSAAGKYIFHGLQGLEIETAKIMANPPAELTTPQAEAVLLPQDQQDAFEKGYVAETQAAVPEAMARAEYWKMRAENADQQSEVDPALANTIPARLSAAAGHATMMGMESLIPGAGLPLMVLHGALATEAEAKNAGKTDAEAEDAAVRSAIGLGIFGGASKIAALGVAKLLPKVFADPGKLTTFVAQFVGQEAVNEASSRAIGAWEAAENAPEGQKVKAAINALSEQTLEGAALNLVFAGMGAAKATGHVKPPVERAPSPVSEPVETGPKVVEPIRATQEAAPEQPSQVPPVSQENLSTSVREPYQRPGIVGSEVQSPSLESVRVSQPEPTRTEPNAASKIGPDTVPEYLRPDPELVRLINEPAATVKPQMKMAAAGEGGALFSRGGARSTVAPKGETPRGDTNFLRVEPGMKRAFKGLERKGAADVIADTPNKVGKMLSNAMRKHVDVEQEITGQLTAKLETAMQGPGKKIEAAFEELEPHLAARENGRPTPPLSTKAQEILSAWEDIAESTGNLARANNVQVFDPTLGAHRQIGNLGRTYLPRAFKPEVERVMRDPKQNPTLWNNLVDAFATHRGISDVEAAKELRAEAGRFSSNDFMGNLERARTGQLPEIFYDYDLRRVAARYIPSFSERMSQIIAYGQRLGPREKPQRENLWDIARKESENDYTQRWLNSAEDQAVNLRAQTASGTGMARAQTLASGLLLASPTTSVMRNTLSGLTSTVELMGVKRSLAPLVQAIRKGERANAREMGAVRSDIGDFLHADQLGKGVTDDVIRAFTDKALKFSGYNGSEVFVRTHATLASAQFARDGAAAIAAKPTSMRSKEALALFQRMGVDAKKIVAEKADWKNGTETRKFIRTVIRDTQGGYRFDQVPLWANGNAGRFLYQFGRWGTQRARNIWKNGIKPAMGEEVQWNGKTMTRRDVRPLAKMAISSVLLGEAFAGVASLLFGRDRRDASTTEIAQAWDEDKKLAFGLAAERAINDIIMAGTLGIWGQPIDWAKSLKNQSRLKNPTEPPGLSSVKALMEMGQAAIDQEGAVTNADLLRFAGNLVPGGKQLSDVARNIMDEPLYEAQNDVRTLRAAAQRWAKREGMDVSPRNKGDFRKSPMAPEYEPIKDALLVGDADTAKVLAVEFLNKQVGADARTKAKKSLKASIQQSQPFRAGPYTAKVHRERFQTWARANLSEADYLQTKRIQDRYMKAAQAAELW